MSAHSSVFHRARRALRKSVAATMALLPALSVVPHVASPTSELARITVSSDSRGYRRTRHVDRYYRSVVDLYK